MLSYDTPDLDPFNRRNCTAFMIRLAAIVPRHYYGLFGARRLISEVSTGTDRALAPPEASDVSLLY